MECEDNISKARWYFVIAIIKLELYIYWTNYKYGTFNLQDTPANVWLKYITKKCLIDWNFSIDGCKTQKKLTPFENLLWLIITIFVLWFKW